MGEQVDMKKKSCFLRCWFLLLVAAQIAKSLKKTIGKALLRLRVNAGELRCVAQVRPCTCGMCWLGEQKHLK